VLSMSLLRSACARQSALSGLELAPDELTTGQDPDSVARFREPVLTTAQRVLRPLAVVGTGAAA